MLIVNVASKCGFTPQYKAWKRSTRNTAIKGLSSLASPATSSTARSRARPRRSASSAPSKYNVTFPLMAKVEVNGDGACDLYKYLKALKLKPKGSRRSQQWNFEKFLVGRDGQVVARFLSENHARLARGREGDRSGAGEEVKCWPCSSSCRFRRPVPSRSRATCRWRPPT